MQQNPIRQKIRTPMMIPAMAGHLMENNVSEASDLVFLGGGGVL